MTADPAYYLSIYIHAHKTGNSVPPHVEAEAIAALKSSTPEPTTMNGFLATKEAVEEYLHDANAQSESTERPIWTEGVCGDGAAILKDGVMQPIEDVIAALNAAELAQPEPVGPRTIQPSHLEGQRSRDEVAAAVVAIKSEPVGPTDNDLLRCMIEAADSVPGGQATGIIDWEREAIAAELKGANQ
jgi:hypothetical protein